jgi:hypothetical protein
MSCGSTSNKTADTRKNQSKGAAKLVPISESVFNRQWTGLVNCQGIDYWFNASFTSTGQDIAARFTYNNVRSNQRKKPIYPAVSEIKGLLERRSRTFRLNQIETRTAINRVEGIFNAQQDYLILGISGPAQQFNNCSALIMVPVKNVKYLTNRLAQSEVYQVRAKNKTQANQFPQTIFSQKSNLFGTTRPKRLAAAYCSRGTKQWVQQYIKLLQETSSAWNPEILIGRMYSDSVFSNAFRDQYWSKTIAQGQKISRDIAGTQYCGLDPTIVRQYQHALTQLLKPLASKDHKLIINNEANLVYTSWLNEVVPAIDSGELVRGASSPITIFDWVRSFLELAVDKTILVDRQKKLEGLVAKRSKLSLNELSSILDETIAQTEFSLVTLTSLADTQSNKVELYRNLSNTQKHTIDSKIMDAVNQNILSAITKQFSQPVPSNEFVHYRVWKSSFRPLLNFLNPKNVNRADEQIKYSLNQQSVVYVSTIDNNFSQRVISQNTAFEKAEACIRFDQSVRKEYKFLNGNQSYTNQLAEINRYCEANLAVISPAIQSEIKQTKFIEDLNILKKRHARFVSFTSETGKALTALFSRREQILNAKYASALQQQDNKSFMSTNILGRTDKFNYGERGRSIKQHPYPFSPTSSSQTVWQDIAKHGKMMVRLYKNYTNLDCSVDMNKLETRLNALHLKGNSNYRIQVTLGASNGAVSSGRNNVYRSEPADCFVHYKVSLQGKVAVQVIKNSKTLSNSRYYTILETTNVFWPEKTKFTNGYVQKLIPGEVKYMYDILIPSLQVQ